MCQRATKTAFLNYEHVVGLGLLTNKSLYIGVITNIQRGYFA